MDNQEAILWHISTDLAGSQMERKQYHISIIDGNKRIETIVTYQEWDKKLTIEPYLPHEYDYTVHDGCDHEEDYCVLDDPDSAEYQDMELQNKHHYRVVDQHPETARVEVKQA